MDIPLAFIFLPLDSVTALYAALFLILVLSGIGLPLPEEITLLFGGYLAYLEFTSFWPTVYVLILGIIAADVLGYLLGRFAGEWVYRKIMRLQVLERFMERAKLYFEKHGEKIVLFSRPLIWVRVAVPIMAGHFKMNFMKFLIFDAIGAIPWTLFLVSISYYLGSGIDLITEVKEIKHFIFILLWIAIVIYAVRRVHRNSSRV